MKQPAGWKRGVGFWVGVVLLSISAFWWVLIIIATAGLSLDIRDAVSIGIIPTVIPIVVGTYSVMHKSLKKNWLQILCMIFIVICFTFGIYLGGTGDGVRFGPP